MNKLGANGYFSILKYERGQNAHNDDLNSIKIAKTTSTIRVTSEAYEHSELINEAEADLKLEEVSTMITTIVSFGRPNHQQ